MGTYRPASEVNSIVTEVSASLWAQGGVDFLSVTQVHQTLQHIIVIHVGTWNGNARLRVRSIEHFG